jgi:hypothetical protein
MDPSGNTSAVSSLQLWLDSTHRTWRTRSAESVPATSQARQLQSLSDRPIHGSLNEILRRNDGQDNETVLYLGYGSNLSAETFRGKRGIRPISQVNVVVPTLSLTFDLPGIPYQEPCFGNVRNRDENSLSEGEYHKNRWPKGLVGVVYEVTKEDYIHIIATEGGGSGYQDVLVDCYALSGEPSQDVPLKPAGQPFKAHTLFAPAKVTRPNPSYAQPSPRYLKLITDGAAEHGLPLEYQAYLHQIRTFRITSTKQRLGQFVFLSVWSPFFLFLIGGAAAIFLKADGTYPKWFATFMRAMFTACWASYDHLFKKTFGDGERTVEDGGDEVKGIGETDQEGAEDDMNEKEPLIQRVQHKYGVTSTVEEIV